MLFIKVSSEKWARWRLGEPLPAALRKHQTKVWVMQADGEEMDIILDAMQRTCSYFDDEAGAPRKCEECGGLTYGEDIHQCPRT